MVHVEGTQQTVKLQPNKVFVPDVFHHTTLAWIHFVTCLLPSVQVIICTLIPANHASQTTISQAPTSAKPILNIVRLLILMELADSA